jgi:hypothetical protein
MTRDSRIDMTGTEMDLKSGPRDMRTDTFTGGEVQMDATMANISKRTDPMGRFDGAYDKHVAGGKVEMQDEGVPLHQKPNRGWDSYETPMSTNSEGVDSRSSGYPTPKGRKF